MPDHKLSRAQQLRIDVSRRVDALQRAALATPPSGAVVASLAKLRRCDPGESGRDPDAWALTLEDVAEDLRGKGDNPSRAEEAIHAALVLYALHQQSRSDPMHRRGVGLGRAVRELALARGAEGKLDDSTLRRFHQVALAPTPEARLYHLRSLITLMRAEQSPSIGLDYGQLAVDLYRLRDPQQASKVLVTWGRDLHTTARTTPSGEEQ